MRVVDTNTDISSRSVYVVAIGKAAPTMAIALNEVLGHKITGGVITGPRLSAGDALDSHRWQAFVGGHPLPNQESLAAARAVFSLLKRANEECALVIFLISGGGSTMIEWPTDERITLSDLREANRQLISCGASISEINAVRRACSAVKGGKLAAYAPRTDQITLIISDTNRGDEASVASGPTLEPLADTPHPRQVLDRYRLGSSLPATILTAVDEEGTSQLPRPREGSGSHYVLLDNHMAIAAAAAKADELRLMVEIAEDISEQSIGEGCNLLISRLRALWKRAPEKPVCLLSGGEFRCPVNGNGIGGRNSETVVRCAIEIDEERRAGKLGVKYVVALSAGTDGIDGNSPAAGAIADENTLSRARLLGLDAESFLAQSDSYGFLNSLGDTIVTGPTGTNVRDLRVLLASNTASSS